MSNEKQDWRIGNLERRLDGHEDDCKKRHTSNEERFDRIESKVTRIDERITIASRAIWCIGVPMLLSVFAIAIKVVAFGG